MTRLQMLAILAAPLALGTAACSPQDTQPPAGNYESALAVHDDHNGHEGMHHEGMDHEEMDHAGMTADAALEASAAGVLNAVDIEAGSVNLTHPPMPEIGWPAMTMDLPVTRQVDLSAFEVGQEVRFTVRRGRDNMFRIVAMQPAQ